MSFYPIDGVLYMQDGPSLYRAINYDPDAPPGSPLKFAVLTDEEAEPIKARIIRSATALD